MLRFQFSLQEPIFQSVSDPHEEYEYYPFQNK